MLRKASEAEYFPYTSKTNSYLEVTKDGTVNNFSHHRKMDLCVIQEVYDRVLRGESKLYCAWPGQWTTDIFEIDTLVAFGKAFGLYGVMTAQKKADSVHKHSFTWRVVDKHMVDRDWNTGENTGLVHVELGLLCGCDLTDAATAKEFKESVKEQLGWNIPENCCISVPVGHLYMGKSKDGVYKMLVNGYSLQRKEQGSFNTDKQSIVPEGHVHTVSWKASETDDESKSTALLDITFDCGCEDVTLQQFADFAQEYLYWQVYAAKGKKTVIREGNRLLGVPMKRSDMYGTHRSKRIYYNDYSGSFTL